MRQVRLTTVILWVVFAVAQSVSAQSAGTAPTSPTRLEIAGDYNGHYWIVETAADGSRRGGWISKQTPLDRIDRSTLLPIPPLQTHQPITPPTAMSSEAPATGNVDAPIEQALANSSVANVSPQALAPTESAPVKWRSPSAPQASTPPPATRATTQRLNVKIVDRHTSDTNYSYVIPGRVFTQTNVHASCLGYGNIVNCYGSGTTTGVIAPPLPVSYTVRGATFTLALPDGRFAVVNCDSKYALRGDYINTRSCRMPLVDDIRAEFKGDGAKLIWSVSLDGKKEKSETYKILSIISGR